MKIFILAGGFGTRLKSVVSDVPKPMAPINNKPFLTYQVSEIGEYFPNSHIYILTYYLSEIIEDFFKNYKNVTVLKENEPLGTGGSIKNAIIELGLHKNDSILVFNGDTYIKPNLKLLIESSLDDVNILASMEKNCDRYGTLDIKGTKLMSFNEKKKGVTNSYINAGCYYFKNLLFFKDIKIRKFSIEDEFTKYISLNNSIGTFKYNNVFIDIGIPSDYQKMENYIVNGNNNG